MAKRKTPERFRQEVFDAFGDEYTVLEDYQTQSIKVLVRHNKCGREYRVKPDSIIRGVGCSECFKELKLNKDKRVSTESIHEYLDVSRNGEFELVEHYYKDGKARIRIKHLECGTINDVVYGNFKNQAIGCPHCAEIQRRNSRSKTDEQFKKDIFRLWGHEYIVLGNYSRGNARIKFKHVLCGEIFSVTPFDMLSGAKCPKCTKEKNAQDKSMTHDEYVAKIREKWGDEYEVLGKYERSQIKIRVRHECGHEYSVAPASLLSGSGCIICCQNNSKGCKEIAAFLKKHGIDYVQEFKIEECRFKHVLPFDFAVLDKDKLKLLIEFDGEQHFKAFEYFGGNAGLEVRERRDRIKDQYCKRNDINLLRIRYDEMGKIHEILRGELL